MDLGQQLELARRRQAMTQAYLAQRLNVPPEMIDQWEGGVAVPTPGKLQKLCEILEVPSLTDGDPTCVAELTQKARRRHGLRSRLAHRNEKKS